MAQKKKPTENKVKSTVKKDAKEKKEKPKLTAKQKKFCEEYLIDLNATQAAIRSGYSENTELIGFYVYFLVNPINNKIFYIGKGCGKRLFTHVSEYKRGLIYNKDKHIEIDSIIRSGNNVQTYVFESNLDESAAFYLETIFIRAFKKHGLTNISNGCSDNVGLVKLKAQTLLSKIKEYNLWISQLNDDEVLLIKKIWGSTRECYNYIEGGLRGLTHS